MVSVILPIYNSKKYLKESIQSIIDQSYTDWEILAINEYGSDDGSAEIIQEYANLDSRIKLIQNEERLGLANSLNKGFKLANGEYLARLDADDLAHPTRFEKQVEFMEHNPGIGICGTFQHHFGENTDWIHKTPLTPDECRASLLFGCDMCHSTVMLRKKIVIDNNLFYDDKYLAEDYELWIRGVAITDFANIPEVLGEYRIGKDNITNAKKEKLNVESGIIVSNNLRNNLKYNLPENKTFYFRGWENPFNNLNAFKRERCLQDLEIILKEIVTQNNLVGFYDHKCLLNVIAAKWRWIKYGEEWNQKCNVDNEKEIFDEIYRSSFHFKVKKYLRDNPSWRVRIKYTFKFLFRPFIRPISNMLDMRVSEVENFIEYKTWDRYQRTNADYINTQKLIKELDCKIEAMIKAFPSEFEKNWRSSDQQMENKSNELTNLIKCNGLSQKIRLEEHCDKMISQNKTLTNEVRKSKDAIQIDLKKYLEEITKTTDARIWKAEQNLLKNQELLAELIYQFGKSSGKQRIILINAPSHDNLGDHAIAYAEKRFCEEMPFCQLIEITGNAFRESHSIIVRFLEENDIIAISGGGYLGSLWEHEEQLVEQIIREFPNNRIVIFPQSLYFDKSDTGKAVKESMISIFKTHNNLMICAREETSYQLVQELFPSNKALLVPDMVFYLYGKKDRIIPELNLKREGVGICLKSDKESILSQENKQLLQVTVQKLWNHVSITDTAIGNDISNQDRYQRLHEKLIEFSTYELIITDRLHGMIFSYMTGTPCLTLDGKSHKICSSYHWIESCGYVKYITSVEEAIQLLNNKTWIQEALRSSRMKTGAENDFAEYYSALLACFHDKG